MKKFAFIFLAATLILSSSCTKEIITKEYYPIDAGTKLDGKTEKDELTYWTGYVKKAEMLIVMNSEYISFMIGSTVSFTTRYTMTQDTITLNEEYWRSGEVGMKEGSFVGDGKLIFKNIADENEYPMYYDEKFVFDRCIVPIYLTR